MRLKYLILKQTLKRYVSRKWQLFRTPKEQRPVIRLLWEKMDEAKRQMADDIGRQLYGGKELDGLGSILDDDTK